MSFDIKRLNLDMAITAWKTLWLEHHSHENPKIYDLVWQPTQRLLDKLSENPLPSLTFFSGKPYVFPENSSGVVIDLFFVGDNRVCYIGTLFSKTANRIDREQEVARLIGHNKERAEKLRTASPFAIVRDAHFCIIPADIDALDTEIAEEAIKKYLERYAPKLLGCKIEWLLPEQGYALIQQIKAEAERTAQPPTREEQLRVIIEDEFESS